MYDLASLQKSLQVPLEEKELTYSCLRHNFGDILNTNQIQALTSLIYDIGLDTFLDSKIPAYIQKRQFVSVTNHFFNYCQEGRTLSPVKLDKRRKEVFLFNLE